MLLKAGTYRFNDVLSLNISPNENNYYDCIIRGEFSTPNGDWDRITIYPTYNGVEYGQTWGSETTVYHNGQWVDTSYQTITINEDTEVEYTFGTWYITNTNYNEVNAPVEDTIYTEKSSWYKSVADAIRNKKGISAPILRDNFAREILSISGGGGGECSGEHIIEVDELPEVGEEGAYYAVKAFSDVVGAMGGEIIPLKQMFEAEGMICECYVVATKPTEDIKVSDGQYEWYFYYVKDENDIFVFVGEWASLSALFNGLTFIGEITSLTDISGDGYYALMGDGGLYQYSNGEWTSYIVPSGVLEIGENGVYNVTDSAEIIVNVNKPTVYTVQSAAELPTDVVNGSLAIVLEGE